MEIFGIVYVSAPTAREGGAGAASCGAAVWAPFYREGGGGDKPTFRTISPGPIFSQLQESAVKSGGSPLYSDRFRRLQLSPLLGHFFARLSHRREKALDAPVPIAPVAFSLRYPGISVVSFVWIRLTFRRPITAS